MIFNVPKPPRTDEFYPRNKWYSLLFDYLLKVREINTTFSLKRVATAVSRTTDDEIIVGTTATSITITLATAELKKGRVYIIKDEGGVASGGSNVIVATQGSATIDGAATKTISTDFGVLRLYSDETNWFSF